MTRFSGAVLGLALVLLTAACAPRFGGPEVGPGPEVAAPSLSDAALVTRDGTALPLRVWRPPVAPTGNPHRETVVIALHGFNDHANAFAGAGRWLAGQGFVTYAYDQRGFGAAPHPGDWPGQDALIADLADAVAAVRARHPGARVVLLGGSMGGAVILAALADPHLLPVDGVVLAAPAVWGHSTMPWVQRAVLAVAERAVPGLRVTGRGLDVWASDNFAMLRALGADPLVLKRTRVDAIAGLVDLMETAYTAAGARADVPMLWLYGQRDEVVPLAPTVEAARRLDPARGQRFALYPQGWHMLLRDRQGPVVLADITTWLRDPQAPLPSGAETDPATVDPNAPRPPRPPVADLVAPAARPGS